MKNPCDVCNIFVSFYCTGNSRCTLYADYRKKIKAFQEKIKTVSISSKATPTRGEEMTVKVGGKHENKFKRL